MMITKKMIISENFGQNQATREIVRDIIKIYKEEYDGEFYLPEHFDEEMVEYEFPNITVSVELILEADKSVRDFIIDASIWKDEDVITVKVVYNPNVKEKITYNLIGSLNEVIHHELQHYKQRVLGMYDLYADEEPEDPFKYYTQPHEIDAQVAGFKRMAKITKRPFEQVVRNWFSTHKDIHRIPENKIEDIISLLLKHKN